MKLQLFAVRPLAIPFFVALSIVSTAFGETPVPERHDERTPTAEATPSVTPSPLPGPTANVRPSPTPNAKVATVEAFKRELDKLADASLLEILKEGPKTQNLDRQKLEDALKRVAPFDKDAARDRLLRSRVLDTFQKAVEANLDQKGENLLALAIADVLRARQKLFTPTPTVAPSGKPPTVAPSVAPTAVPTARASATPTVLDAFKALQDQLKALDDQKKKNDELAKNLNDALNQGDQGAGAGAGDQGSGGSGSGSGDQGSGDQGSGNDKGKSDSASKDSPPDTSTAKNDTKPPPEIPPASASSDTKKDGEEKDTKSTLDLSPKKTNLFGDSTPKAVPAVTPLASDASTPGDAPVRAVPRGRDLGPSEPINQAIGDGRGQDDGSGSGGGAGRGALAGAPGYGNGSYRGTGSGSGSSTGYGSGGNSDVLRVGNFPSGGGGGGPYTYIKTGPGDWLQAGGGSGDGGYDGGNALAAYDEAAAKTAAPADQILRVVADNGGTGASGGSRGANGSRGLAGSGTRMAGHGVFSNAPTVQALCSTGLVEVCGTAKLSGRRADRRM